jgi:HPt (histidine-containing phosphotransfer) domain-containing protein
VLQMDGIAATKCIRQMDHPLCDIPIVALTANALDGDRVNCLRLGFDEYVSKPLDMEALRSALQRAMHKSSVADSTVRSGLHLVTPPPPLERVLAIVDKTSAAAATLTVDPVARASLVPIPHRDRPDLCDSACAGDAAQLAGIELPVLDADRLQMLHELDGVGTVLRECLRMLAETLSQRLAKLTADVFNGVWSAVALEAHAIKGAAANVGARRLSAASAALEKCARSGTPDGVEVLLSGLIVEGHRARASIRAQWP